MSEELELHERVEMLERAVLELRAVAYLGSKAIHLLEEQVGLGALVIDDELKQEIHDYLLGFYSEEFVQGCNW